MGLKKAEKIDQESELIATHAWVENRKCFWWCNCDSILRQSSKKLHHLTQEEEKEEGEGRKKAKNKIKWKEKKNFQ